MPSIDDIERSGKRSFGSAPEHYTDPEKTYVATMQTDRGRHHD